MILPGAMLGVLGGGQLGRMFTVAARTMGYRVTVLDPDPASPAAQVADACIAAPYDDAEALARLARECVAVTTEFENVPAASLEYLAKHLPVRPAAGAVAVAQDRIREKTFLRDHGFETAGFATIARADEIDAAVAHVGTPALMKTARLGYDGRGQARVDSREAAHQAFAELGATACVLEEMLKLEREVSVVLARGADGEIRAWPVTENRHRNGILDVSLAPALVPGPLADRAVGIASAVTKTLDYVGVLAVEFFVCDGDRLLVNEFAPRPHNSGHWTIDGAATSQFEQQVRALCGLPLGDASLHRPTAMVNLLGDLWRKGQPPAWDAILSHPEAKLHLYGKEQARPGRKMGHFTCFGATPEAALALALEIKGRL